MQSKIVFKGRNESDGWEHYAWVVTINGHDFEYKTGLGHASNFSQKDDIKTVLYNDGPYPIRVHVPSIDSVLECLFSDAECGQMSFNDFCSDFGYSNDSFKAFDIYKACMECGERLRKALGAEYRSERERIAELNK